MNKKAQELELRNIMQGLEEFATFMSFKGNTDGLRILSVESVAQTEYVQPKKKTGQIVTLPKKPIKSNPVQSVKKSLSFQDREYH